MSRFKYPIGHPCYYEEPDPIPCEGGCPDGQICDDDTGLCVEDPNASGQDGLTGDALTEAASLLDSFYDTDSDPFDEVPSEEGLPYPNEQITFEENNIQFAARDKIVANQGCAYWIWDSPASLFVSQDVDETALGTYFTEDWDNSSAQGYYWGFPGLNAVFQDPLNYYQARNYDPLRWSTGRVWTHRTTQEAAGALPSFVFPSTLSSQEHVEKYTFKFIDPPNSSGGVLYSDASGNYLDETIYVQFGGLLYSTLPEDRKFEFLSHMLSGGDYIDHTVDIKRIRFGDQDFFPTGEVEPKSRKTLMDTVYNDPDKVEESLLAKFFSKGFIGERDVGARVNNQPQIVPKSYFDFAHKTQMPFFEKESKKMNISNGLSADILIHRNFFSKEFQSTSMGTSEDIFKITNCYRHYRERKRPDPNCQLSASNQVDRILKFSAANIKEMNEVTEQYKKVYPVTAQIRLDTTQKNTVSDMFVRYGMDKYLLDQREKFLDLEDARSPEVHRNSNLDLIGQSTGQLDGAALDEFYYAYDIGGYSIFRVRTYAEYLNQISMKKNGEELGEIENYMKTNRSLRYKPQGAGPSEVDNRAFNISTEMRTAYLEDFLYQLKRDDTSPSPTISDQLYGLFDDNMFPLGALDTSGSVDDAPDHVVQSSEWRKLVNDFNREVFSAKMSNLPYQNINSQEPGSPTSFGKYSRSVSDIFNGKLAYSEVLGYSVEKYEHGNSNEKNLVQKFYFFDSSDVTEINFLDNQLRYNKKYTYVVKAINCVFGSEYYYRLENEVKKVNPSGNISDVENEDLNFIDEFVESSSRGDVQERDRRLREALESQEVQSGTGWSNIAIGVRARSKPKIAFIEVPYFKKTIHTIDLPPMPPQVEILPYKGDLSKVLLNLTPSAGEMEAIPRPLLDYDMGIIDTMYAAQDVSLYKNNIFHPSGPIKFSGDSMPTGYEVLILENPSEPPISIERFATAKVLSYGNLIAGNLHKDLEIRANVPNYLAFRSIDTAGVSILSEVYYVELVSHQDGMYLVVDEYVFPEPTPELVKVVKNAIEIEPSRFQYQKANRNADIDMSTPFWGAFSVSDSSSNIFDKEYRLNIRSKTTGREMNIDFDFNVTQLPPVQADDDSVGDEELDMLLQACNKYSDLPQNRADSEFYHPPDQINTGEDEFVRACPSEINKFSLEQHEFYSIPNRDKAENIHGNEVILQKSVPLSITPETSSKKSRRRTGANAGQCECPPGFKPLSSVSGFGDIDPFAMGIKSGAETICIQDVELCPAGSKLTITPYTNEDGKQVGTIIHCECSGDKTPCGSGCYDPCEAMHVRNPENCNCKPNCPSPKVWNGTGCKCPGEMVEDPFGNCVRPQPPEPPFEPEPPSRPEFQDRTGMYDTVLSPDEIMELERAGYINDQMRRMIEAGTVDAETVLELKDRLRLEGDGVTRPLEGMTGTRGADDIAGLGGGRAGDGKGDETVNVGEGLVQKGTVQQASTELQGAVQQMPQQMPRGGTSGRGLPGGSGGSGGYFS